MNYAYTVKDTIIMEYDNDTSDSVKIKKLYYFENYKQNIDRLDITFKNEYGSNTNKTDIHNSLKSLKSSIFQHLNKLTVSFDYSISIEYLKWLSVFSIVKDKRSHFFTIFESIMEKLIPKASIVVVKSNHLCDRSVINQFIRKGYFQNISQLTIETNDIPDDNFFEIYTTENIHHLESIEHTIYFNNHLIYNSNNSVFRFKYDTNSCIDTIIDKVMNEYEIETFFECLNENRIQQLRNLRIYVYDDEESSKLINFITTGKIPKLREFLFMSVCCDILYKQIDIHKQGLEEWSFIQKNHVYYKFEEVY
ncbi:hypothetical protein WA158_005434 [Blastocystis sp. Blastoise]